MTAPTWECSDAGIRMEITGGPAELGEGAGSPATSRRERTRIRALESPANVCHPPAEDHPRRARGWRAGTQAPHDRRTASRAGVRVLRLRCAWLRQSSMPSGCRRQTEERTVQQVAVRLFEAMRAHPAPRQRCRAARHAAASRPASGSGALLDRRGGEDGCSASHARREGVEFALVVGIHFIELRKVNPSGVGGLTVGQTEVYRTSHVSRKHRLR